MSVDRGNHAAWPSSRRLPSILLVAAQLSSLVFASPTLMLRHFPLDPMGTTYETTAAARPFTINHVFLVTVTLTEPRHGRSPSQEVDSVNIFCPHSPLDFSLFIDDWNHKNRYACPTVVTTAKPFCYPLRHAFCLAGAATCVLCLPWD